MLDFPNAYETDDLDWNRLGGRGCGLADTDFDCFAPLGHCGAVVWTGPPT